MLLQGIATRSAVADVMQDAFGKKRGTAMKMLGDILMGEGRSDGATAGDSQEMAEIRQRFRSMGILEE